MSFISFVCSIASAMMSIIRIFGVNIPSNDDPRQIVVNVSGKSSSCECGTLCGRQRKNPSLPLRDSEQAIVGLPCSVYKSSVDFASWIDARDKT